jgi:uncharacterized membrane protein YphA (DoxX/SURF4 family)
MTPAIPIEVVYAGLGGTVLALVVATAQQNWQPKVFFLLALRLAIGWHFLFEGLHKIHSYTLGPTDTSRPFSSEMYFKVAPTKFGAFGRSQFGDPLAVIAEKLTPPEPVAAEAFRRLSAAEQAAKCPPSVAKQLDAMEELAQQKVKAEAEAERKAADDAEAAELKAAKTDAERAAAKAKADKARAAAAKKAESFQEAGTALVTAAKATYARWVYGVDGRETKVKFFTGDAALSAPQRLAYLDRLRADLKDADDRRAAGLGNGKYEVDRAAALRTDLQAAEADLAKDATAFVGELKAGLTSGKPPEEEKVPSAGERMDHVTMWFIAVVGGCVLFGLFTRVACVLAAGFLVMTYLTHPAVPWFPMPPNTEGNPLFVNKNVIECLALLSLACMPTGRWLGLDALVLRPFDRRRG